MAQKNKIVNIKEIPVINTPGSNFRPSLGNEAYCGLSKAYIRANAGTESAPNMTANVRHA
jgi:hypothetical protein